MSQENFISLYDYLGKAAGAELGKLVNEYAQIRKQPHKVRYVEHPGYAGYVNLYTKEFLDEYFEVKKVFEDDYAEINTQLMEDTFKNNENENYIF